MQQADEGPTPAQRGVMTAWALLFDDITRTLDLSNPQAGQVDLWLTMAIVLSLCIEHPTTMRRAYEVMKQSNFPLWHQEPLVQETLRNFEQALGMSDDAPEV